MQVDQIMQIAVSETAHAFRVNGVTIAKRHLAATLGEGRKVNKVSEKILAKYLVIVPFLATGFVLPDKASDGVKYGYHKAQRLYKAIGLTDDTIAGFMLAFLQIAEMDQSSESITALSGELRAGGFYGDKPSFQQGERQSPKKTLH